MFGAARRPQIGASVLIVVAMVWGDVRPQRSRVAGAHDDYEGYELIARRMWVILPSSWFRVVWDWVLILFVLYNLVFIPLEMCARHGPMHARRARW
jgi:hypothetical protein